MLALRFTNIQLVFHVIIDADFITITKVSQLLLLVDFLEMAITRLPVGH